MTGEGGRSSYSFRYCYANYLTRVAKVSDAFCSKRIWLWRNCFFGRRDIIDCSAAHCIKLLFLAYQCPLLLSMQVPSPACQRAGKAAAFSDSSMRVSSLLKLWMSFLLRFNLFSRSRIFVIFSFSSPPFHPGMVWSPIFNCELQANFTLIEHIRKLHWVLIEIQKRRCSTRRNGNLLFLSSTSRRDLLHLHVSMRRRTGWKTFNWTTERNWTSRHRWVASSPSELLSGYLNFHVIILSGKSKHPFISFHGVTYCSLHSSYKSIWTPHLLTLSFDNITTPPTLLSHIDCQ